MPSQAMCSYPCTHLIDVADIEIDNWRCITDTLIESTIAMLCRHWSTNVTCMSSTKVRITQQKALKAPVCDSLSHTQTCRCIMLAQSILDPTIADVVWELNYLANITIYIWSCTHTVIDMPITCTYTCIVSRFHTPPCNSSPLHVLSS